MKFLVFNMVVAAALFYLFAGETNDFRRLINKADTNITKLKSEVAEFVLANDENTSAKEIVEKPQDRLQASEATVKTPTPMREKSPVQSPEKVQETASPEIANIPTTNVITPDNRTLERRKEVISTNVASRTSSPNLELMAPKIRKRELLFLAEELEILAAKLANE